MEASFLSEAVTFVLFLRFLEYEGRVGIGIPYSKTKVVGMHFI